MQWECGEKKGGVLVNEKYAKTARMLRDKCCNNCLHGRWQTCRKRAIGEHCGTLENVAADLIEKLASELEQAKREQDAAKRDLELSVEKCEYCKKAPAFKTCPKWQECSDCYGWEWRGPCAENGGTE